uniref:Uncharacterized protein n=1 Tax=Anopheles funestus TaxID=62324 RepID=A0A182S0R7_ANOFN
MIKRCQAKATDTHFGRKPSLPGTRDGKEQKVDNKINTISEGKRRKSSEHEAR